MRGHDSDYLVILKTKKESIIEWEDKSAEEKEKDRTECDNFFETLDKFIDLNYEAFPKKGDQILESQNFLEFFVTLPMPENSGNFAKEFVILFTARPDNLKYMLYKRLEFLDGPNKLYGSGAIHAIHSPAAYRKGTMFDHRPINYD